MDLVRVQFGEKPMNNNRALEQRVCTVYIVEYISVLTLHNYMHASIYTYEWYAKQPIHQDAAAPCFLCFIDDKP